MHSGRSGPLPGLDVPSPLPGPRRPASSRREGWVGTAGNKKGQEESTTGWVGTSGSSTTGRCRACGWSRSSTGRRPWRSTNSTRPTWPTTLPGPEAGVSGYLEGYTVENLLTHGISVGEYSRDPLVPTPVVARRLLICPGLSLSGNGLRCVSHSPPSTLTLGRRIEDWRDENRMCMMELSLQLLLLLSLSW